jgi:hypothetical protein
MMVLSPFSAGCLPGTANPVQSEWRRFERAAQELQQTVF